MATTSLKQLHSGAATPISATYRTSSSEILRLKSREELPAPDILVAVLVDSISGNLDATTVNKQAIQIIRKELTKAWDARDTIQQLVVDAIERANKKLFELADVEKKIGVLGASVIIAVFITYDDKIELTIFHVGNCRAYLLRGDEMSPLTSGHTWGQEAVARGFSRQGDRPTRYLGYNPQFSLDTTICLPPNQASIDSLNQPLTVEPNDLILLCTTRLRDTTVKDAAETLKAKAQRTAHFFVQQEADLQKKSQPPTLQIENPEQTDIMALVVERRMSGGSLFGIKSFIAILLICLILLSLFLWRGEIASIATSVWSAIVSPFQIPTPTSTPVPAPTDTPKPIVTETPTPTAINTATATPIPTPTALPIALASLVPPTPTPTPTHTATVTNTPRLPTATPVNTPQPATTSTPMLTSMAVTTATLPLNITSLKATGAENKWEFTWSANRKPNGNEKFEVIFWRKDPKIDAFGIAAPMEGFKLGPLDLDKVTSLTQEGDYHWGIRLATTDQILAIGPEMINYRRNHEEPSPKKPTPVPTSSGGT